MNKKIAIIGAGLFGVTTYLLLKQKGLMYTLFYRCTADGASSNNLNRVHFAIIILEIMRQQNSQQEVIIVLKTFIHSK